MTVRIVLFIGVAVSLSFRTLLSQEFEVPLTGGTTFFKGNTHTHTTMSDGDSPPGEVARWYKTHGYRFLVLSDHNAFTDPDLLAALVDSSFLLIRGEELTSSHQRKPVHINGLNILGVIPPQTDSTLLETIQKNVDAVRAVGGIPHINHPNFGWAIDKGTLLQVRRDKLLEIFNGHPQVHNYGGSGHPGTEEIWDFLLSAGTKIYGIAVDDAHHFKQEFGPSRSNPGKGWIVVRASKLDAADIMSNLEAGNFYASTGVELTDVQIEPRRMVITLRQKSNFGYRTDFIGEGGRVLLRTESNPAVYELEGRERYVRARVTDSGGFVAWVQPAFVKEK